MASLAELTDNSFVQNTIDSVALRDATDLPKTRIIVRPEFVKEDDPVKQDDSKLQNIIDKLFGLNGQERYQLWPEKLVRDAISAPHDVMTGEIPQYVIDPVTGEAQAARYDLSKQVNLVSANKQPNGKYLTYIEGKDERPLFRNSDGFSDNGQKEMTAQELEATIGKEAAEKIINGKPNKEGWIDLRDKDLKVGGQGMKAFYDKMLVDKMNKLISKYDSKVKMVDHGQMKIPAVVITPKLKEKVLKEGFPLFSAGVPVFTPIDYNPFENK